MSKRELQPGDRVRVMGAYWPAWGEPGYGTWGAFTFAGSAKEPRTCGTVQEEACSDTSISVKLDSGLKVTTSSRNLIRLKPRAPSPLRRGWSGKGGMAA